MSIDFFKPEDFIPNFFEHLIHPRTAAELANAKIEKEGMAVFGSPKGTSTTYVSGQIWNTHNDGTHRDTHKALLINIEPLEICTHPKEKVKHHLGKGINGPFETYRQYFECDCGVIVKPIAFKEIK